MNYYYYLIGILFSFFIFYCISMTSIKKFFIRKTAREFLTMGNHQSKKTIPSMGGIPFIIIPLLGLWYNHFSYISIGYAIITISSWIVGLWDDYEKIYYNKGISARYKFFAQALGSLIGIIFIYSGNNSLYNYIDCKFFLIHSSLLSIIWLIFIIVGTSHAVNLTDGLDGLAASQLIIASIPLLLINQNHPFIFHIALIKIIIVGLFLLFNTFPARLFMGDCGALFLGSSLATLFIINRNEWTLVISGVIFVIETISVILQYCFYKYFKRRLFLFAPIHHHFEKKGYSENQIVLGALAVSIIGLFIFYNFSSFSLI
jgi:phospho-N-acetylmuramoyl-pentapeptide-transferase